MTDDELEKLRINRPALWERRQRLLESLDETFKRLGIAPEQPSAISIEERIAMAREMAGDLAQDVEVGDDGSVTVTLAPRH